MTSHLTLTDRLAASGEGFDRDAHDFDILNRALADAGLTAALANKEASLTLLAPTDAAFISLAQSFGVQGHDEAAAYDAIVATLTGIAPNGDPLPLLQNVLLYHVVGESLTRRELLSQPEVPTLLDGASFNPSGRTLIDGDTTAENPMVVGFGKAAVNGRLFAIDEVLLPFDVPGNGDAPTIADLLADSGEGFDRNRRDFDILNAALDATGLTGALDDADADLTLFAPTDAAFLRLARDLGYRGNSEEGAFEAIAQALSGLGSGNPVPLLTDILTYHVVGESLTARQITATDSLQTLSGEEITVSGRRLGDLEPDLADPRLILREADLEASNGFIHAIDRVLLPFNLDVI